MSRKIFIASCIAAAALSNIVQAGWSNNTTSSILSGTGYGASRLLADAPAHSTNVLQGTVKNEQAALESLKEIHDITKHMKAAATDLLYETQRPDFAVVGTPTVIGTTVIPSRPDPSGMVNMGSYLPPRQKWIDYFMTQLSLLIPRLKTEADAIAPVATQSGNTELMSDMQNEFGNLNGYYTRLLSATKAPPYSNMDIAKEATGVSIISDRIEKDRKDLERAIKRDEKEQQKELRGVDAQPKGY